MRMTSRKGFTLIELLIVVVIIGILAAIAIPKFANTKEKAYIAAVKSDLKNLVTVQESYFADRAGYANATEIAAAPYSFAPSAPGTNATLTVNVGTPAGTGWSATLVDARVTSTGAARTCGVFVGGVARPAGMDANQAEGTVGCW
jgi:prepilin-type N-terminal cleavage/methylation domain-containing protein